MSSVYVEDYRRYVNKCQDYAKQIQPYQYFRGAYFVEKSLFPPPFKLFFPQAVWPK